MPTKLKVVEPTAERVYLRIYWHGQPNCKNGADYHNAMKFLRDDPHQMVEHPEEPGFFYIRPPDDKPGDHAEAEWPTACETCGAPIPPGHFLEDVYGSKPGLPTYQVFQKTLYDNPPRELQPGDVFDAHWMPSPTKEPFSGERLAVVMPGGDLWVNGRATNCTDYPRGTPAPVDHSCWKVTGKVPNITVHPSILTSNWHGFITNGVAEP